MDRPVRRFVAHGSILPDPHGSDRAWYLSLGLDGYYMNLRHMRLDRSGSDNSQLKRLEHGARTVPDTELRKNIGDMILYRAFGHTQ